MEPSAPLGRFGEGLGEAIWPEGRFLAWIWAPFGTPFGTFWRLWSALEGLLRRPERLWRRFWEVFLTPKSAPNAEALIF